MKRRLIAIIVCLLAILSLSGCESTPEDTVSDEQSELFADEYYMPIDEFVAGCEEISSDTLLRESESRFGEKIRIKGKIFQVVSDDERSEYLVWTKLEDYGSFKEYVGGTVWVGYERGDSPKFLEDDVVTMYGIIMEDITYTNTSNQEIKVPSVLARKIELN